MGPAYSLELLLETRHFWPLAVRLPVDTTRRTRLYRFRASMPCSSAFFQEVSGDLAIQPTKVSQRPISTRTPKPNCTIGVIFFAAVEELRRDQQRTAAQRHEPAEQRDEDRRETRPILVVRDDQQPAERHAAGDPHERSVLKESGQVPSHARPRCPNRDYCRHNDEKRTDDASESARARSGFWCGRH